MATDSKPAVADLQEKPYAWACSGFLHAEVNAVHIFLHHHRNVNTFGY